MQAIEEHQDEPEKPPAPRGVYARPARGGQSTGAGRAPGQDPAVVPWVPTPPRVPAAPPPAQPLITPRAEPPARQAQPPADLPFAAPRKRWIALCFALTLLIYLALIPQIIRFSSPPTGDQAFYLMVTASIVQDHDLDVANNYTQLDEDKFYSLAPHPDDFVGMGAPYPLNQLLAFSTARPASEKYDFRMPGLPALIAPAWWVGSWFALWWPATVVFMCLLGALVGVNIFLLAYALSGRTWIAWAVWLPLAFSNPVMSYSFLLFTELPTALFVLYAFRRLAHGWGANGPGRLLLVGACIGAIPWMSWRCLPIAGGLVLFALAQWWRHYRATHGTSRNTQHVIRFVAWLLPLALSGGLLAWYNLFLFGSLTPPNKVPELGDAPPFLWPWAGVKELTNFVTTGFALLLDRQMGLLPYAPIYLLAAVGLIAMLRIGGLGEHRLVLWLAVVALPYTGLIMSYLLWNGLWCPPARFLTPLVPLLAGPLAASLRALARSWLYRILYALLAVPGLVLMAIMMHDPRLLWPANPVYGWLAGAPEWPLHFDARPFLPAFSPLDGLTLPRDTGWMTVAAVLIVLLSYLLLTRARSPALGRPLPYTMQGLGWLVALLLVGASWWLMNGEYLKHLTLLAQQNRWDLNTRFAQPLGITVLDGRVFLVDYQGALVGALDTQTGAFETIVPTTAQGPLTYAHPGDVKVGPDGLLYVLNNGPGDQQLLGMRPDGQVVRQIALEDKSDVAVGLSFGPDGKIYVGDMVGGRVREYGPAGGAPIADLTDPADGFNNLGGITVMPDGTIYATDVAANRVVKLASDGRFLARYPLGCSAWYIAADGDWLEAACNKGVMSINTKTGAVQGSRVEEGSPALVSPTGLTFGPDGLLYVLDGSTIAAYRVEH